MIADADLENGREGFTCADFTCGGFVRRDNQSGGDALVRCRQRIERARRHGTRGLAQCNAVHA